MAGKSPNTTAWRTEGYIISGIPKRDNATSNMCYPAAAHCKSVCESMCKMRDKAVDALVEDNPDRTLADQPFQDFRTLADQVERCTIEKIPFGYTGRTLVPTEQCTCPKHPSTAID